LEIEDGSAIRKTMKKAENGKVEAAIYQGFIQKKVSWTTHFGNFFCEKP
jgi:hypothetical protein